MKRALIFIHYNSYNKLSDHVLYSLDRIKHIFDKIYLISNSPLNEKSKYKLSSLVNEVHERQNKGFDFGAWKEAVEKYNYELNSYDSVTFMNDTCFGPLYDLEPEFKKMESSQTDFWGITNHRQSKDPKTKKTLVPEHIQSYFFSLSRKTFTSDSFGKFLDQIINFEKVEDVILNYEIKLTKYLVNSGFQFKALINTNSLNTQHQDLATWHPDTLIKENCPFIKIKSFLFFKNPKYLKEIIKEKNNFPVNLIDDYFYSLYSPNTALKIVDVNLDSTPESFTLNDNKQKTAIHIHVYYTDVFEYYLEHLSKLKIDFHLFLTTSDNQKKDKILFLLQEYKCIEKLREIFVFENKGRDVLPWIKILGHMENYETAGHFHTKKTDWAESWIGDSWQREIFENLIINGDKIISSFISNEKLGIVIPDIPFYYSCISNHIDTWGANKEIFNRLFEEIEPKKQCKSEDINQPIMPFGNMFWYKPKALAGLSQIIKKNSFDEEPLPDDGTIAHTIERLPVYLAWANDYQYKISIENKYKKSSFYQLDYIKENKSYTIWPQINIWDKIEHKAGKIIVFLPKKIYRFFKFLFRKGF